MKLSIDSLGDNFPPLSKESGVSVISDPGIDDLVALTLVDRLAAKAARRTIISTFGNAALRTTSRNADVFSRLSQHTWQNERGSDRPVNGNFELPWQDEFHGLDGVWGTLPDIEEDGPQLTDVWNASGNYISLAPLTELQQRIGANAAQKAVIMGGAFEDYGNVTAYAECNIANDPEAAALICQADQPVDIGIVPLDVTRRVSWRIDTIQEIPASNELNIWLKNALLSWYANFRPKEEKVFKLHDPLAAYLAYYPDQAEWVCEGVDVMLEGEERGRTVFNNDNAPRHVAMGLRDPEFIADDIFNLLFVDDSDNATVSPSPYTKHIV